MRRIIKKIASILLKFPLYKVRLWALRILTNNNIGNQVYVGSGLTITMGYSDRTMNIRIGDRVSFGPNVTLVLATHPNYSKLKKVLDPFPPRKLEIGDDSWLGAGVIIMPNVKIGKMCVIGAGSVVTRDVPDFSVVVGSPARIIRTINNENN